MAEKVGLKLANGEMYPVLEKGVKGAKRLVLTTVSDGQDTVHIDLFRLAEDGSGEDFLGELVVDKIAGKKKGEPDIELELDMEEDGKLVAQALDKESGTRRRLEIQIGEGGATGAESIPDFAIEGIPSEPGGEEPFADLEAFQEPEMPAAEVEIRHEPEQFDSLGDFEVPAEPAAPETAEPFDSIEDFTLPSEPAAPEAAGSFESIESDEFDLGQSAPEGKKGETPSLDVTEEFSAKMPEEEFSGTEGLSSFSLDSEASGPSRDLPSLDDVEEMDFSSPSTGGGKAEAARSDTDSTFDHQNYSIAEEEDEAFALEEEEEAPAPKAEPERETTKRASVPPAKKREIRELSPEEQTIGAIRRRGGKRGKLVPVAAGLLIGAALLFLGGYLSYQYLRIRQEGRPLVDIGVPEARPARAEPAQGTASPALPASSDAATKAAPEAPSQEAAPAQAPGSPQTEAPASPAVVPPAKPQDTIATRTTSAGSTSGSATAKAKPKGVWYKIKRGDTLWDISYVYYRDPYLYGKISRANKLRDPDYILAGAWLYIPPR